MASFVKVLYNAKPTFAGSSVTISPTAGMTSAGDAIIIAGQSTSTVANSVTDSLGNTYAIAVAPANGRAWIAYCLSSVGALTTGDTITIHFNGSPGQAYLAIGEYVKLASLDKTGSNTGSFAASPATVSAGTITSAPEVAIISFNTGSGPNTPGCGAPYTARAQQNQASILLGDADYASITSVTGNVTYGGSATWNMVIATFPTVTSTTYTDSATIAGKTTLNDTESVIYVDSSVIVCQSQPIESDIVQSVEVQTVAGVSTPILADIAQFIETQTIGGTTSLNGIDTGQLIDDQTFIGTTGLGNSEVHEIFDTQTIDGITTININDITVYVEGGSLNGITTLIGIDTLSTDVDSATIDGVTTLDDIELHTTFDGGTIAGITDTIYTGIREAADAPTVGGITTPIWDEIYRTSTTYDTPTVSGITEVYVSDFGHYVDGVLFPVVTYTTVIEFEEVIVELSASGIKRWVVGGSDNHFGCSGIKHYTAQGAI